ncbi:MAG: hypothetical protein Q8936_05950 [Bacillota bacterium]|nr:hypothetical protein [Bacillota bacterium]
MNSLSNGALNNPDLAGLFDDWNQGQRIAVLTEGGLVVGNLVAINNAAGIVQLYNATIFSFGTQQTVTTVNIRINEVVAAGLTTTQG